MDLWIDSPNQELRQLVSNFEDRHFKGGSLADGTNDLIFQQEYQGLNNGGKPFQLRAKTDEERYFDDLEQHYVDEANYNHKSHGGAGGADEEFKDEGVDSMAGNCQDGKHMNSFII